VSKLVAGGSTLSTDTKPYSLALEILVRLHPRNANKEQVIVSGLTLRERAVRREAAEGFFALYAGRVHAARHGVQDWKRA